MTTTPDAPTRAELIAGLRDFVDFLDGHPDVPLPHVAIYMWAGTDEARRRAVAEWVYDLDEVELEPATSNVDRKVIRRFGALAVAATVPAEFLGEGRDVPEIVTRLVPFTVAEIVARAQPVHDETHAA